MPELTQANLRQKNMDDHNADPAREKQTVKRFHEEYDRYCDFLVTGDSVYQRQEKAKGSLKREGEKGNTR